MTDKQIEAGEMDAGVACLHEKWTWAEDGRIRCARCGTYNECHEAQCGYSKAIGDAGEAYMAKFAPYAHPLPAQFRWSDLWAALCAASAQQDEREASDLHAAIMNIRCSEPSEYQDAAVRMAYRIGHRDARHAAAEIAAHRQVQADAAVGTAVAELEVVGTGAIFLHETEHTRNSFVKGKHALYAHPDPLLAECVEALEEAIALRVRLFENGCDCGPEHTCNAKQRDIYARKWGAVLAKVQAAKETP